jgi:hypothetical protein
VGVAGGLSFLVPLHHVGAEDTDGVLALVEQSLRASFLGTKPRDKDIGVWDTRTFGPVLLPSFLLPNPSFLAFFS